MSAVSEADRMGDFARLRVPPHSLEAEQSMLGGLLLDNSGWDRCADLVQPADFYRHEHKVVFEAIAALVNACRPADVITVHERIQAMDRRKGEGISLSYLNSLASSVPSAANIRRYAEIVREHALRRALAALGDEVTSAAFAGEATLQEQLEHANNLLAGMERQQCTGQQAVPIGTLVVQRVDRYSALAEGEEAAGWPTGIEKLDELLNGGLRPGHVMVLAARPKVGKTSLAMAIAENMAATLDLPVLVLSQEMPAGELADRTLSRQAGVNGSNLQTGRLSDDEWSRISEAASRVSRLDIEVDDQPGLTLADVRAKARRRFPLGRRTAQGRPIGGLMVLDYLQLMSGTGGGRGDSNRNNELQEISRGIKVLAKQLGIGVIELSQLNRKVDEQPNQRPRMHNLRDSGAIEADADEIVLMWTARVLKEGALRVVGIEVAANRHGPTGEFGLDYWPAYQRWESTENSIEPPTRTEQRSRGDFE